MKYPNPSVTFISMLTLFSTVSVARAETIEVIQFGKTFVQKQNESRLAAAADSPAELERIAVAEIEVKAGDSIVFANRDAISHNLYGPQFDLKIQPSGARSEPIPFKEPGEVMVNCAIHPKMKLKVKVK